MTTEYGWTAGNNIRLFENGDTWFPRLIDVIGRARERIVVETFLWFADEAGCELRDALAAAARRGVRIDITIDGYGCGSMTDAFKRSMTDAGIQLHVFDPRPSPFGIQTNWVRRLHRKIVTVDRIIAFIGGINFADGQVVARDPMAKQDYAVELSGPVVADIHAFAESFIEQGDARSHRWWLWRRHQTEVARSQANEDSQVLFVTRDNGDHPHDIEDCYVEAITEAQNEIVIANAYFFPGWWFLRHLRAAALRGVRVRLLLQGQPDKAYVKWIDRTLYDHLLNAGIEIHEYRTRPFHGKVAVIDRQWMTVGSSNLDPLSLSLNLEANVVVRDRSAAADLSQRLEQLFAHDCVRITRADIPHQRGWRHLIRIVAFHFARRFPAWARWLPMRRQTLRSSADETRGLKRSAPGN